MGMLVGKNHLGLVIEVGDTAIINDVLLKDGGKGRINNEGLDDDPYIESTPDNVMNYLNIEKGMNHA